MSTVKTESKTTTTATAREAPKQADLQTAYEIHTLVQLVHGQIAVNQPWATPPVAPRAGFPPTTAWPPSMAAGVPPTWPVPTAWTW